MDILPSDIKGTIENYMHQEQSLLSRLREIKTRQGEPSAEIGKTIISELGGALVGDFLDLEGLQDMEGE